MGLLPLSHHSANRTSSATSRDQETVHKIIVRENSTYDENGDRLPDKPNPIKLAALGKIKITNNSHRSNTTPFNKE